LADATQDEKDVLGAFTYSVNDTALHTDESVMPKAQSAQSSWNYLLSSCRADTDKVLVTYDMNRLQQLPTAKRHLVSLNAGNRVAEDAVLARMRYTHPIFTPESVAAQRRLAALTTSRTTFAGAYHGWGFHEDGCRSGVEAAAAFGVIWS
jgi:predicted NAD/FAD-binding protein